MNTAAVFFLALFLVFLLVLGGIVFAVRTAEARAAAARAQAAWAEKEGARFADFNLVAQPNDGGRQVKAATDAGAITARSKLYWDFWEQFLNRVDSEHQGWTKRKTSKRDSR